MSLQRIPQVMAILAQVQFEHPDGALVDTLTSHPELEVILVPNAHTDPNQCVYVARFNNLELHNVRPTVDADHTVANIRNILNSEDHRLLGIEFSEDACLLDPKVVQAGGFVLEARSAKVDTDFRGWYEEWLLPNSGVLSNIWEYARQEGFEFELIDMYKRGQTGPDFARNGTLTDKQSKALITAYEHGYFADPRETSLEELSDILDLSPAAVGGRLRRGIRALIELTILQRNHHHYRFGED